MFIGTSSVTGPALANTSVTGVGQSGLDRLSEVGEQDVDGTEANRAGAQARNGALPSRGGSVREVLEAAPGDESIKRGLAVIE